MLREWFISFGWRAEDVKWIWGEIVSLATLVTSGTIDVAYWTCYVGIPLTPTQVHIVQVLAIAVLWISGKYQRSPLH